MTKNENNKQGFYDAICDELLTMSDAISFCVRMSKRTPKQVHLQMEMDAAHWSKVLSGTANFPHDKLIELMEICGNDIPVIWLAKKRGLEVKPSKQTLEAQLKKYQQENNELKKTIVNILENLKKGTFHAEDFGVLNHTTSM